MPCSGALTGRVKSSRLGPGLPAAPLRLEAIGLGFLEDTCRTAGDPLQVPLWFSDTRKPESCQIVGMFQDDTVSSVSLMINFLLWFALSKF